MERFKWIPQSLHGGDQDREDDLLGEFEGSDSWSPLQVLHLLCRFRCLIANLSFVSDSLFLPLGQRLYGFAASLVIGFAFVLLSLIVFYRPIKFGIMFTFGNILAVGSTAFLIGPVQQARMMLDPVRIYATAIYVGSAIVALVCALWIHSKMLTLIAIIIEICALVWYSLSYVPFARRMVSELFASCCDTEF
ncbi:Got1/Sft2-like family [Musa troglodytarum]|uniref:Vesicle transport protein n=2 Tax=Musa troglodytarum TaxID=320322 RepID=A0A9E7GTH4_9LILI|nr:Got1/Sft2-like family [Musa troglodytarum]